MDFENRVINIPREIWHKIIYEHLGWASREAFNLRLTSKSLVHPLTEMFFLLLKLSKAEEFDPKTYFIDNSKDFSISTELTLHTFKPLNMLPIFWRGFNRLLLISNSVNASCKCLINNMLPHI